MKKRNLTRKFTIVLLVLFSMGCSFIIPGFGTGDESKQLEDTSLTETAIWGIIQTATERANQPTMTATSSPAVSKNPYEGICDWAEIVSEGVSPSLDPVPPNYSITMKWQLRNVGTCTWNEAYAVVLYSGAALDGPEKYFLSKPVAPGETVDIVFNVSAPSQTGLYSASWKLRNPDGEVMGIGNNSNGSLSVKLNVGGEAVTPQPTQSGTKTPTLAPLLLDRCDAVQVLGILTIPDSRSMPPGVHFNAMWRLRNIGGCTWTKKYALEFISGDKLNSKSLIYMPREVQPAEIVDVYADMRSPITAGTYTGYWKIRNDIQTNFGQGASFNDPLVVSIKVNRSITITPIPKTATPKPTITASPTSTKTRTTVPNTLTATVTLTHTPTNTLPPTLTETLTLTPTATATQALYYSFADNVNSATWTNNAGTFTPPGDPVTGKVETVASGTLRSGIAYTDKAIIMNPDTGGATPFLEGTFTLPGEITNGDRFITTVGCPDGNANCAVRFIVKCGTVNIMDNNVLAAAGPIENFDFAITSPAAGITTCTLRIESLSVPTTDGIGVWVYPRMMR